MPVVTCSKCGAKLSSPKATCPSCGLQPGAFQDAKTMIEASSVSEEATLAPPKEAVVAFESLAATLNARGGTPTIQEPPPSSDPHQDAAPALADAGDRTVQEPPPSRTGGSSVDGPVGDGTDAATLKTDDTTPPRGKGVAHPPSDQATLAPVLPSKEKSPSQKGSTGSSPGSGGAGRSSFLQSGLRSGGGEGQGELFDNGKYEIVKEIARGGMGAVYKARQRDLNRIVALKVMLSGAMASEGEKKRFLREAEASAKLKHPNIVPVYDIGEVDGNLYFTMDFVEGAPLSEKKAELDRAKLLDVMIKVCDAVAYAHMRGIIHRDLKPANVMMDKRGEPLIMDFGLAKETSAESDSGAPDLRTREGSIMGTPHYMPPEQAEGAVSEIDVRSDVYALGVILFELWTGRLPFVAKRVSELMRMVIEQEPPSPRSIDPSVPWEIEAIALRAMEKQKAKRYETALDMKRDLERFKNGEAILARQASALYRARKWVRRNRIALATAGALVVGSAGLGVLWHRQANRQWLEQCAEGRAKIDEAASMLAATSKDASALPSSIEEAKKSPGAARRKTLDELLKKAKKASTDVAGARGSLRFSKEVERELLEGIKLREKESAELAALLEKSQEQIDAALADLDRETKAGELMAKAKTDRDGGRFRDARSNCLAAAALGLKDGVDNLLGDIQGAEREAESKDRELYAAKQLADGGRAFHEAEKDPSPDVRLAKSQEAIAALTDGLTKAVKDETRRELEQLRGDAQILYANALFEKRYYALARIALAPLKADKDRPKLAEKAAERDAAIAKKEKDAESAVSDLDAARVALQSDDPSRALAKLRSVGARLDVLSPQEQDTFRRLLGDSLGRAISPQADLAVADTKWDAAEKDVTDIEADLRARTPDAPALVAPIREVVELARAEFRLLLAKRLQETNVPRALDLVNLARAKLKPGSAAFLDAESLAADLDLRSRKPKGMERIPQCVVQLGGVDETNPLHAAEIKSFYLCSHEVTNREFAAFVAAGGYADATLWGADADPAKLRDATGKPGPKAWRDGKPREGTDDEPVTGVSWHEAAAFAAWKQKQTNMPFRLPTDDEWEAAARLASDQTGTRKLLAFPWGDDWGTPGARLARSAEERRGPSPVREDAAAHPEDRSACNCYDMTGNVAEWVAPDPARTDPGRGSVRGGSFLLPYPEACTPAHRSTPKRTLRSEAVGFRIALDAKQGAK